jgi:hypothetical protein
LSFSKVAAVVLFDNAIFRKFFLEHTLVFSKVAAVVLFDNAISPQYVAW